MRLVDSESTAYDRIGDGYAVRRMADPRIAAAIDRALGQARTVVNVGAGSGSYESGDRQVVAIEPSRVMAAQRTPDRVPAVLARAEALPLVDDAADAAMAILTVHHWSDPERGIGELVRVARERVVLLTVDPAVEAEMWLFKHYLPEVAEEDAHRFPSLAQLRRWLGGGEVETVPVPADCRDGFLLSFWSRPELVLEPDARSATSGFARLPAAVIGRVVHALARDLSDGSWDRRHGHLRGLSEYDAGLRLVVSEQDA